MSSSSELTFARRDGRTVLAHSRVQAPLTMVRPFPLTDGRQLVQLITLGPGFCGGDTLHLRITADQGASVVVTTTAATRLLSMHPGAHAEQHVEIAAARGATIEYYPAVTIPFPDSAFVQRIRVDATEGARVGVLDTWALGRTARGEYLEFRSLSSRTALHVDGAVAYLDATEIDPVRDPVRGVGILAGRRYLATGFWYGATVPDEAQDGASDADLLVAFGQSRPGIAYLRALGSDAPALEARLRDVTGRIAAAWGEAPVPLDRFRC